MVNVKKIEKITITGTALLIFSIIMFLFPIHSIIAKPTNCEGLPSSGNVELKSAHQGQSWDYFSQEDCGSVELNEGQYLWHLVLSPVTDGASATIDGIMGDNHGGSIHWTFINNDPNAQNWVASVSGGLKYSGQNCNLQTDLRVSHTCAGIITSETTAPVTTVAETTAPVTTAPVTTVAETTAPVTTALVTTVAETTAPVTTAPVTTAPVTTVAETTAPITTAAVTTAPVTTVAETTAPTTTPTVITETTVEILAGTSDIRVAEGTAAAGVIQVLGIKRLAYTGYNFSYLIIGAIALLIGIAMISIKRLYRK